jgi:hypothetical protein
VGLASIVTLGLYLSLLAYGGWRMEKNEKLEGSETVVVAIAMELIWTVKVSSLFERRAHFHKYGADWIQDSESTDIKNVKDILLSSNEEKMDYAGK